MGIKKASAVIENASEHRICVACLPFRDWVRFSKLCLANQNSPKFSQDTYSTTFDVLRVSMLIVIKAYGSHFPVSIGGIVCAHSSLICGVCVNSGLKRQDK